MAKIYKSYAFHKGGVRSKVTLLKLQSYSMLTLIFWCTYIQRVICYANKAFFLFCPLQFSLDYQQCKDPIEPLVV